MNLLKTLLGAAVVVSAQMALAAPPSIMVLPEKNWCIEHGYTKTVKDKEYPDYEKAIGDKEFRSVNTAFQQLFAERGFPMVDATAQSEEDDMDDAMDEAFEGAKSGASAGSNAFDELVNRAKPDITVEVEWSGNNAGSLYSADFNIKAIDTYSSKAVSAIAAQTGEVRRTVPLTVALKQAVKNNFDSFCALLQQHFDDLQANGREIRLDVRILDNGAGTTMNTEFGGQELSQIIYEWVSDNTVNHQFNQRSSGRTRLRFNQVRIPMKDTNGRPMDAKAWARGLQQKLAALGLPAENSSPALGLGRLYIGEK